VPAIIRYYLNEYPILPNIVRICSAMRASGVTCWKISTSGSETVGESGGYGMLIGPHSTAAQREEFRRRIGLRSRNYIAQPTLALSRAPCFIDWSGRSSLLDLRPYILYGDGITIVPGGLTRVALQRGSLVVNSSAGWRKQRYLGALLSNLPCSKSSRKLVLDERYLERAEHTCAVARSQPESHADQAPDPDGPALAPTARESQGDAAENAKNDAYSVAHGADL